MACRQLFLLLGRDGQVTKGGQRCFCLVRCLLKCPLALRQYLAGLTCYEPLSDVYLFMIELHQLYILKTSFI